MAYATVGRTHFAKKAVETVLHALSRDKDRAEGFAAFGAGAAPRLTVFAPTTASPSPHSLPSQEI